MAVAQVIDYETWKQGILSEIEEAGSTTHRGDRFVQRILRDRYGLSEDDAINATECAGPGDRGVDAVHIELADGDEPPRALVLQGKYGSAGETFSPLVEFRKFSQALQAAEEGDAPTSAIQQCASVRRSGGVIEYVVATVEPASQAIRDELEDARVLARQKFPDQVSVDAISLADIYQELTGEPQRPLEVQMQCKMAEITPGVHVGAASLIDAYLMLHQYARSHHGVLDSIYDRNVRKWLGSRQLSVNAGIQQTLKEEPENFLAYNNGITIVCTSVRPLPNGLALEGPQIVNGCQSTKTLYDFMENHFAGLGTKLRQDETASRYRDAYLPFKVISVEDPAAPLVKNITRFSNRQNAVRGRDFLALEEDFRRLREDLAGRGHYLEVQTGEYGVLRKSDKERFPRSVLINCFDALRFYGAAVLGKPHTAFGRSINFTPGGREFDEIMDGLTPDDLLVPWLVAQDAGALGYSKGAKWDAGADDHRNQTRYFFLYIFFRVVNEVLRKSPVADLATRHQLYRDIVRLRKHGGDEKPDPYADFLRIADGAVGTYMKLASANRWYQDRNSFLKRDELLDESRLLMVTTPAVINAEAVRTEALRILAG